MSVIQESADISLLTAVCSFLIGLVRRSPAQARRPEAVVVGVTAAIVYTEITGKLNGGLHR